MLVVVLSTCLKLRAIGFAGAAEGTVRQREVTGFIAVRCRVGLAGWLGCCLSGLWVAVGWVAPWTEDGRLLPQTRPTLAARYGLRAEDGAPVAASSWGRIPGASGADWASEWASDWASALASDWALDSAGASDWAIGARFRPSSVVSALWTSFAVFSAALRWRTLRMASSRPLRASAPTRSFIMPVAMALTTSEMESWMDSWSSSAVSSR